MYRLFIEEGFLSSAAQMTTEHLNEIGKLIGMMKLSCWITGSLRNSGYDRTPLGKVANNK
jgi:hypothetical protein